MKLMTRPFFPAYRSWRENNIMLSLYLTLGSALLLYGCNESPINRLQTATESFPIDQLRNTHGVTAATGSWTQKTLIINFWATWCIPCREEMPSLQALSQSLDHQQYAIIGVSIDDDLNLLKEFLLDYQINFNILWDDTGNNLASKLAITAYPETFIVSPEGKILKRITGSRDWNPEFFNKQIKEVFNTSTAINTGKAYVTG